MYQDLIVHFIVSSKNGNVCLQRMLIDGLEERLLIYSESLDKFATTNPGV